MKRIDAILAGVALTALAAAGCSHGLSSALPTGQPAPGTHLVQIAASPLSKKITHVIVIIQENRTTDNLFHGLRGADTASTGQLHTGQVVPLTPVPLATPKDLPHSRPIYFIDWNNGGQNGFDLEKNKAYPQGAGLNPYQYVKYKDVEVYFNMAEQFAFADHFFADTVSESYVQHQYMIAAQSDLAYTNPEGLFKEIWGCDSAKGTTTRILDPKTGKTAYKVFPCFDYTTLGDELDAKSIKWKYYAAAIGSGGGNFSAYDAIKHIRYGPDWTADVSSPETNVLSDIQNGTLPSVSWVTPKEFTSDHAGSSLTTGGPAWVASIVNAVGASKYWPNTAIFITWDEWGGWYDHLNTPMLDAMGPGFRVPLVIISPYAKHGYVSKVPHENGSILHFIEEDFGVPAMTTVDSRADDLLDAFNFQQPVKPLKPFKANMTTAQILALPNSPYPPDDDTGDQDYP